MEALVHQKKSLVLVLLKQTQSVVLSLHYNADNSYLFVNGKKPLSLKMTIKVLPFQLSFVSEVFLMDIVL